MKILYYIAWWWCFLQFSLFTFFPGGQLGVIVKIKEGFYTEYYKDTLFDREYITNMPALLDIAIAILYFGTLTLCVILPFFRSLMSKNLRYTIAIVCCIINLLIVYVPKLFGPMIWEEVTR